MRKLHDIARQKKMREIELYRNVETSDRMPSQSSLSLSVNSLQQLLEQSDSQHSQDVIIDNISSIRASSHRDSEESQSVLPSRRKPQLPKFTFPKKHYRQSAKQQISHLKQRRKQLDSAIYSTDYATKYQVDKLWQQVEIANKQAKHEATTIIRQSATNQFVSILQKNMLRNAMIVLKLAQHIDRLTTKIDKKMLRKCFDGWWFESEQRKQKARMLLIMKKRIKQDDKLRKVMYNI